MSVPDAPTNVVAIPGNLVTTVTWNPGNDNGSTIYGYKITSNPVSNLPAGYIEVLGPTTTTAVVQNLLNNTSYQFKVNAINQNGVSPDSTYSSFVTPYTIPNPPTNVVADASNGYAKVSWIDPTYNGGSAIYGYTVTSIPEGHTASIIGVDSSSVIVNGLTNGTSYNFSVVARNAAGNSSASVTTVPVIPKTVPTQPTNVIATPGNAQVTLEWNVPSNSGGIPITNYIIYTYSTADNSQPKTPTITNSTNTIFLIKDLSINTGYYFAVAAINNVGNSNNSSYSNNVTTFSVPDAPTNIIAQPGVNSATVSWTAPTNVSPTGYDIYMYPYSSTSISIGSVRINSLTNQVDTTTNVYNLQPNTSYSFVVVAKNDSGTSTASIPSNIITTFNIPGATNNISANTGNKSATVFWTDGSTGGSPITSYIINAIPTIGSPIVKTTVTTNPGDISGLLIDMSYSFTVTAINAVGTSDLSGSSTSYIHTYGYPNPPSNLSYEPSFNKVTVSWNEPSYTGGNSVKIIGYHIVSNDGQIDQSVNPITQGTSAPTSYTINNLVNGKIYTLNIYSVNIVGESTKYSTINVIPARYPDPPKNVYAEPSNQSALVYWTDVFNGGSPITSYNIKSLQLDNNAITNSIVTTNPAYISGLQIDASYTFSVNAINRFGYSRNSSVTLPIRTFNYPGIPTNVVAFSGTRSIKLFWSKPISDGRSPIIGYTINLYEFVNNNYSIQKNIRVTNVTDLSYTIPGLLDNTGYIITMNSINVVGSSPETKQTQTINTFNIPNPPNPVVGVPGDFQVYLNWTTPYNGGTNILRYDISVNPGIFDTSVNIVGNQSQPNTSVVISKLLTDVSYNFTVNAVNDVGSSIKSTVLTLRTNKIPDPPTISNIIASNSEVTISWNIPQNGGSAIKNYIIKTYKKQQNTGLFVLDAILTVNNITSTLIKQLINGISYKFTIIAVNGVGQSIESDYSDVVIPIYIQPPPTQELSDYCKKTCHPMYKKMVTSTNNPNVSKRMLYSKTVNNKCSVKNNLTYDQLVAQYNFPPIDTSGINQRQAVAYTSPAFLNAMF